MKNLRNKLLGYALMAAVGEASTAGGAPEAATAEAPKAPPVPRAPKLTLTFNETKQLLLKYPFPVKAAKFPVTINGETADAACTAGRGKAYTYLLFKNTSFYVPGTLPVDAVLTVDFPADYKFDDAVAARVSNYKPKKVKKEAAPGEAGTPVAGSAPAGEAGTPVAGSAPDGEAAASDESTAEQPEGEQNAAEAAPKAKRRGK